MLRFNHLLNDTLISTAATAEKLFIKASGAICGAGEKAAGVSVGDASASGKPFGVCLYGIALVSTGGSVTVGAEVEADAAGKAVVKDTGIANGLVLAVGTGEARIKVY